MEREILLRVGRRHRLVLATKRTAWAMAEIFGLRRLHDYLLTSASLSAEPVWLMGVCYKNPSFDRGETLNDKVMSALLLHFGSLMHLTYRHGFSSEGLGSWTSDVGWGCTIRSGQMMMAQALLDHLKEPQFRLEHNGRVSSPDLVSVVSLFYDSNASEHAFSLHHLCQAALKYGLGPGSWMGPGFVCRLLRELNNAFCPFNLRVELIAHPDGAPFLTPSKIQEFKDILSEQGDSSPSPRKSKTPNCTGETDELHDSLDDSDHSHSPSAEFSRSPGLVLLVPLVLGMTKIDERYLVQLKEILTWIQTIGFIGGRSNSSMYFVGFQEDNLLYLDPHRPQHATAKPTDLTSYFNSGLRHMPMTSLVTSLSLGFYCKSQDELMDLMEKLRDLEKNSNGAPIISFLEDGAIGESIEISCSEDSSTEIDLDEAAADRESVESGSWEFL